MQEVEKKTLTVTVDQHEAVINMKRGKDTVYDVIDRLIIEHQRLGDLERQFELLENSMMFLNNTVFDLKEEMKKWENLKSSGTVAKTPKVER